jgi:multidrug efflux pump
MGDVTAAITQQNLVIAPGRVGDAPAVAGQMVTVPLTVQGQLRTAEEFGAIVLRAQRGGGNVTLADVASYRTGFARLYFPREGKRQDHGRRPVSLSPGANAVATAAQLRARLDDLSTALPAGMEFTVLDTAPFVKISMRRC